MDTLLKKLDPGNFSNYKEFIRALLIEGLANTEFTFDELNYNLLNKETTAFFKFSHRKPDEHVCEKAISYFDTYATESIKSYGNWTCPDNWRHGIVPSSYITLWHCVCFILWRTMLGVERFTIISGGANGVDLEAERFARDFGLPVKILVPPCHPRSKDLPPLTHQQLGEAIPITNQVSNRLNKPLSNPISLQYIHRNYHVVKQAEMVLAFTSFQPESNLCFGGTSWAVEMAKLLNKILYVYDVQRHIWFWYRHDQDLFYACDQMSEDQFALHTFLPKTAIVGTRNIYDFPDALLKLQDTFKRSLNIPL